MNKSETIERLDKLIDTITKLQIKIRIAINNIKSYEEKKDEKEKEKEKEWDINFIGESVYEYINYTNM